MRETLIAVVAVFLLAAWTPFPTAVGPEVQLDAPPLVPLYTTRPVLASNGNGAMLVTARVMFGRMGEVWYEFYAGFLDENGAPIGNTTLLEGSTGASVASNGDGYLAAFFDGTHMRAARFSSTGTRLDVTPIELGATETTGEVTWDGSAYVVAAGSKAVRVAEDGRVLDSRDIAIGFTTGTEVATRNGVTVLVSHGADNAATGTIHAQTLDGALHKVGFGQHTDVAAGDPGFLVVWDNGKAILGRVLDPSGRPDGAPFTIAAAGSNPAVTWNGTEWLVVFQNVEVRGVRVLRERLAPSFLIAASGDNPAVTADGSTAIVAWDDRIIKQPQVHSAKVEGEQVSVNGLAARRVAGQSDVRMTVVDDAALVAWFDGATRVRRMDGTAPTQTLPEDWATPVAFAAGENEALLVRYGSNSLLFTRLDRNGAPLSTRQYTATHPFTTIDAAWAGNQWVVVFRAIAFGNVSLSRIIVRADGTISPPKTFGGAVGTAEQGLAVVGAGDKALVLRSVQGTGGGRTMTYVIEADGTSRIGKDLLPRMLSAASRGEEVLTARIGLDNSLEWQRFLLDGTVAASGKVALPLTGMKLQTYFTGENYLLLLAKEQIAPNRIELYGFRVDVSGAPIDTELVRFTTIFTNMQPFFHDAVVRDGKAIDVVYSRALDPVTLTDYFTRLVFRTVHDSPRRRVVR